MPGRTIWIWTSDILRSENSGDLASEVILIRVVVAPAIESQVDWIDPGSLGPLDTVDSCNMALDWQPKGR